ncbi:hypothetical protein SAMN04487770_12946 [Butyrivibrio sp. ob235]|uniref:hypothetical protein n=1 Tax=Butyrivibrio sp. ob235 TaxID=1761780 RepID=UPI0008B8B596|nr:hypothetical protein [Butyrivibrio sp. ob235]SEM22772.1 hypothetical protein SAMN04487770_12946 [Butyrivibrio sp. ob235]
MEKKIERRCIQCGKILVGDSKLELCPKCADNDMRGAVGTFGVLGICALGIKKFGKPVLQFVKALAKR